MKRLRQWPFIEAANYTKTNGRNIRLIVIHTMETSEGSEVAEAVARYFAGGSVRASAHLCIDNNSIVRCVHPSHVAWAAPGANSDGLQIELAGRAAQNNSDWSDSYSKSMLALAADAAAQYCLVYKIPIRHLSNAELSSGKKGFIGHVQASEVYKQSSHWDPGPNFPWTSFLRQVRTRFWIRRLTNLPVLRRGDKGWAVRYLQRRLNVWKTKNPKLIGVRVDGRWDSARQTESVKAFQKLRGLTVDGIVGPATWKKLRETARKL